MEAHSAGRRARARAIGWLIAAGAAMVLVWIALPHPDRADDAVVVALVVVTWLLAAALLAGRFDGASLTTITVVLILCAVVISATILAMDDPASGFALFYVCLAPYAFAAGSQRHAVALVIAIAVLYGGVLALLALDEPDAVVADALAGRWLVVVTGSIALGLFARHIATLRRRSEDRFRRGFAHSPVGTAILSEDWRWLEVNDALCRMLGRSREELVGHSPGEVTHPDDLPASRAITTRALAGTPQQRLTKRYVRPDGEIVWATVDSIYVPGRRGDGWFYAHVQDITAERVAQEAIERQARQQAAVAALGRFALDEQDLESVMDARRRDGRRHARGRAVRGLRGHPAWHRAAARRRVRLAGRAGPARAGPGRLRLARRLHAAARRPGGHRGRRAGDALPLLGRAARRRRARRRDRGDRLAQRAAGACSARTPPRRASSRPTRSTSCARSPT